MNTRPTRRASVSSNDLGGQNQVILNHSTASAPPGPHTGRGHHGRSTATRFLRRAWIALEPRRWERLDWLFVGVPVGVLMTLLVACVTAEADIAVSSCFFCEESLAWPLAETHVFQAMYRYGCRPSVWVGVAGLIVGLASFLLPTLKPYRVAGVFLALALAIGPGILINAVLKPYVARPRPCQTIPFGGEQQFAYVGGSSSTSISKSFPSGHASMGFFMMTPALLYYRRRPRLAGATLAIGLAYGTLISLARIAQGAHFTTDVVASALIVYSSAAAILFVLRRVERRMRRASERTEAPIDTGAIVVAMPRQAAAPPPGERGKLAA